MSEPRWRDSLYWRIAFGLFAFLALMLAAQGALFLWITDRIAGSMPARDPRRLAVLVASDVGAALTADPALDVKAYVGEQYSNVFQTFLVIMQDGRVVANHDDLSNEAVKALIDETKRRDFARGRRFGPGPLSRGLGGPGPPPPGFGGPWRGPSPDGDPGRPGPPPPDFGGPNPNANGAPPRPRRGEVATIIVDGVPAGRVAVVPGGPPFSRLVRELGPTMGLVGGSVLGVGMALIAFVIFGPARKRLRHVQDAAERLGGGDLTVRVPEDGGDEVAAVARSFNRMAEELAASDKARRQLLADVSHELMTPLTAMRGYVETLSMPEVQVDKETAQRYLAIVTEETHRLERIIGDLLDLARLEGGGGTMRRETVDVTWLFERVAARHERELRERGVTLVQNMSSDAAQVIGDPDRLEQALQNLAANALRHIDDGGKITLEAGAVEGGLRLRVRDSGSGIPPEHLSLIFDRFYKIDAARKASGGSGLGLSIVKAIVERHGGTIVAYNDSNQGGAVFEIVLPAPPD